MGIDGACRVVENEHLGILEQGARYAQPLLLTAGDVRAALFDIGVVAVGHRADKFIRLSELAGVLYFIIGRVLVAPAQVLGYRAGEQLVLLEHHCDRVSQGIEIVASDIHAAEHHFTARYIVEARDELDERRLRRTRAADYADRLAGGYMHVDIVEHLCIRL